MKRLTQLIQEIEATTKSSQKQAALQRYFSSASAEDAAWVLNLLMGNRIKRLISGSRLFDWAAERAGLPAWLMEESYRHVGDLAECIALVLPPPTEPRDWGLSEIIQDRLIPLAGAPEREQRELLLKTWDALEPAERFVWNKLLTGAFRIGVARGLVVKALAQIAGISTPRMERRLTAKVKPDPVFFQKLLSAEDDAADPLQPFPFFLAHPLEQPLESLGRPDEWQVEWKWDGIRGQLIKRGDHAAVWSRGEELVSDQFPELRSAGLRLKADAVIDGEILAWEDEQPLSFHHLQHRLGRKQTHGLLWQDVPVVFLAYDLLELQGIDIRHEPLASRRAKLEKLFLPLTPEQPLRLSKRISFNDWPELQSIREQSRAMKTEGLMLKRRDSAYGTGRTRGPWWKWKVEPFSIDAVLIAAEPGHGRRSGLHTDFTFGVWDQERLIPVAKAYSGLTDSEFVEIDRYVRKNTLERHGPVRSVKPELVFELHFEGIQASSRHKSGVALRFPRMSRWRTDKPAAEADTLENVRNLLRRVRGEVS